MQTTLAYWQEVLEHRARMHEESSCPHDPVRTVRFERVFVGECVIEKFGDCVGVEVIGVAT